jgi:predicted nucleotidyltransferase
MELKTDPLPPGVYRDYAGNTRHPDEWAIISAHRGSTAHGMYIANTDPNSIDDLDFMSIVVPPREYYYGLQEFGSRGTKEINPSEQSPYDVVIYTAEKFLRLLAQGNPNVLYLLWLDPEYILRLTGAGRLILEARNLFLGKHVYNSFKGYAEGQRKRMDLGTYSGYMGAKRKALVEKHGYDTKQAAHAIRLLRMGTEMLLLGRMTVDRRKAGDAEELLSVKRGEMPRDYVLHMIDDEFQRMDLALVDSDLPAGPPNRVEVSKLAVKVIVTHRLDTAQTRLQIPEDQHICDNCNAELTTEELAHHYPDIPHLWERTSPGFVIPSGECPHCFALTYPARTVLDTIKACM